MYSFKSFLCPVWFRLVCFVLSLSVFNIHVYWVLDYLSFKTSTIEYVIFSYLLVRAYILILSWCISRWFGYRSRLLVCEYTVHPRRAAAYCDSSLLRQQLVAVVLFCYLFISQLFVYKLERSWISILGNGVKEFTFVYLFVLVFCFLKYHANCCLCRSLIYILK